MFTTYLFLKNKNSSTTLMSKKRIEFNQCKGEYLKIIKESKKKFGTQISWIDVISSFDS